MYHAHLNKEVIIRCVLVIIISDSPMGNALTGIRAGGTNGNRHFYHDSSRLHVRYYFYYSNFFLKEKIIVIFIFSCRYL